MNFASLRHRFPGVRDGWSRFDGPAGTQMVDVTIQAMTDWMSNGLNGCGGGAFEAAYACDALIVRTRAAVGQLYNADPDGICFGPNMTSITFALTRAIAGTLSPGDRVVGTRLDHDANVTPWRKACEQAGADHVLAHFDPGTGTLPTQNVIDLIDERTKWVAIAGASNLLGTIPDHAPIIEAAHAVGARVFIDAVALAPHKSIDVAALDCDALVTSPYKWYGAHSGVLWMQPELLDSLPLFKVRPAADQGARRFETGMPNFEAIAGVEAAARFLTEETMDRIEAAEQAVFAPLLSGLQSIDGVRIWTWRTPGPYADGRIHDCRRDAGRRRGGVGQRQDRGVGRPQLRCRVYRSTRPRRVRWSYPCRCRSLHRGRRRAAAARHRRPFGFRRSIVRVAVFVATPLP